MKFKGILVNFLVLVLFLPRLLNASDALDPYYETKGVAGERQGLSGGAIDVIDPFSGSLQLPHVDLIVPGNAGMDIVLKRQYRSLAKVTSELAYKGERTSTGIGWQLHFGRVLTPLNQPFCNAYQDNLKSSKNSVFEAPDGSKHALLPAVSTFGHAMISKSLWVADCTNNGYVIRSPDGTKYYAEYRQTNHVEDFDTNWVTKVEDVHGNYYTIDYGAAGGSSVGNGAVSSPYSLGSTSASNYFDLISQVRSYSQSGSLVNSVEFLYKDVNSTHARLDQIKVAGVVRARYEYTALQATENTKPYYYLTKATIENKTSDDNVWDYQYYKSGTTGLHNLQYYDTPGNARISFTYERENFRVTTGVEWPTTVVSRRTIASNGGVKQPGYWDYDYDQNSSRDRTIVTLPNNAGTIHYEHVGADNYSSSEIWKVGTLKTKEYRNSSNSVVRREAYTYSQGLVLSNQNEFHLYKATSGNVNHYTARLTRVDTSQDGSQYSTTLSNFDGYDNARTISESGNSSQVTKMTFANYQSTWVIGKPLTVNVEGTGGGAMSYSYDSGGKGLLSSETIFGATTSFQYETDGDLRYKDGPISGAGDRINFSNYRVGIPQTESNSLGHSIIRVVDSKTGFVTSEESERNRTFGYSRDYDGKFISISTPLTSDSNLSSRVDFDGQGILNTVSRGTYTRTERLDGLGRSISVSDTTSEGLIKRDYTFDLLGNMVYESDPYLSTPQKGVSYKYDVLGRLKEKLFTADSTKITYDYLAGNIVDIKSYLGTTLSTREINKYRSYGSPDEKNLVETKQYKDSSSYILTTILRDNFGNITSVTQNGKTRTYKLDSRKNLDYVIDPETGTTDYLFDAAGNLKTKKVGSQGLITYSYDAINRLTGIDFPGSTPDVAYEYYDDNTVKFVRTYVGSNEISRKTFDYNENGNMSYERLEVDGYSLSTNYEYDQRDGLSSITYPAKNGTDVRTIIKYYPDMLGRPTKVEKQRGSSISTWVSSVKYHPNGDMKSFSFTNGHNYTMSQDSRQFPDVLRSQKNGLYSMDLNYGIDGLGNVTSIAGTSQKTSLSLGYDWAGRLNKVNGVTKFVYDNSANILTNSLGGQSSTYSYHPTTGRLSSISGGIVRSYGYDGYGNVESDGINTYTYDDTSNLVAATYGSGLVSDTHLFDYDASKNRVKETKGPNSRYTVYDRNNKLIFELVPGLIQQEYIYLNGVLVTRRDDCVDGDADSDKIPNCDEFSIGFDPLDDSDGLADIDGDGVSNGDEFVRTGKISVADIDNDGILDIDENTHGLNIFSADAISDKDGDGVTNYDEIYIYNTSVNLKDTDSDGILDGHTQYDMYLLNTASLNTQRHYRLQEGFGTRAINDLGGYNGTYSATGVELREPSIIGESAASIAFDSNGAGKLTLPQTGVSTNTSMNWWVNVDSNNYYTTGALGTSSASVKNPDGSMSYPPASLTVSRGELQINLVRAEKSSYRYRSCRWGRCRYRTRVNYYSEGEAWFKLNAKLAASTTYMVTMNVLNIVGNDGYGVQQVRLFLNGNQVAYFNISSSGSDNLTGLRPSSYLSCGGWGSCRWVSRGPQSFISDEYRVSLGKKDVVGQSSSQRYINRGYPFEQMNLKGATVSNISVHSPQLLGTQINDLYTKGMAE